eukprot:4915910-Pleurochrysis_carterae.AAC.3
MRVAYAGGWGERMKLTERTRAKVKGATFGGGGVTRTRALFSRAAEKGAAACAAACAAAARDVRAQACDESRLAKMSQLGCCSRAKSCAKTGGVAGTEIRSAEARGERGVTQYAGLEREAMLGEHRWTRVAHAEAVVLKAPLNTPERFSDTPHPLQIKRIRKSRARDKGWWGAFHRSRWQPSAAEPTWP